jgi:hypothetical protein
MSRFSSMSKLSTLLIVTLTLSGCSLPFLAPKQAALQVNTEPVASVYLNGNRVSQTPYYDDNLKPGNYSLKVEVDNDSTKSWETPITLNPQLVTVVNYNFGPSPEESSNYIMQLEELADDTATEVSIITIPDNVIVKINGQPEGFSPISLKDLSVGDHTVSLVAPGYAEESINISVKTGFKVLISSSLAKTKALLAPQAPVATSSAHPEATPALTPTPTKASEKATQTSTVSATTPQKPYVTITETGTGWLRVRSEPNAYEENEVARVDVGKTYPFIDSNESGWYEIEYEPGSTGWISGRFADLVK